MEVRCRECGVVFAQTYDKQLCCPDCVKKHKKSTIADRTCRTCGVTFPGGPRAFYCPDCRADRQRISTNRSNQLRKAGKARKLGSIDQCTICGADYVVNSPSQRYCKDCAPDEYRRRDAEASRTYIREHNMTQKVLDANRKQRIPIICDFCGTRFYPDNISHLCPDCRTVPQGKISILRIRVTPDLADRVRFAAESDNLTVSSYIETLILRDIESKTNAKTDKKPEA